MSKRGGNVLRRVDTRVAARVPNEPRTLLNLLRTLPGVFGSLPKDQVESMDPAVIFTSDSTYRCYFDSGNVTATRPFARRILAEAQGKPLDSMIRAYLVGAKAGRFLFPSAYDVRRNGTPEDGTFEEKFTDLKKGFADRSVTVELGGMHQDGRSADLVPITMAAQEMLAQSHVDYMTTLQRLGKVVEAVMAEDSQE